RPGDDQAGDDRRRERRQRDAAEHVPLRPAERLGGFFFAAVERAHSGLDRQDQQRRRDERRREDRSGGGERKAYADRGETATDKAAPAERGEQSDAGDDRRQHERQQRQAANDRASTERRTREHESDGNAEDERHCGGGQRDLDRHEQRRARSGLAEPCDVAPRRARHERDERKRNGRDRDRGQDPHGRGKRRARTHGLNP